jgi:serine protease AprX
LLNTCIDRLRSSLAAAIAALPTLGGGVAEAATSQAQLATVARKAPARKVEAIAQFNPAFLGEEGPRARRPGRRPGAADAGPRDQARRNGGGGAGARARRGRGHAQPQGQDAGRELRRLNTGHPRTVRADRLWQRGLTGSGVGVAVIDCGVADELVDFKGADGGSRVVANVITSAGAKKAGDGLGHGRHVAGIIAANSFNRSQQDPLDRFHARARQSVSVLTPTRSRPC